jgi:hypothetical protein
VDQVPYIVESTDLLGKRIVADIWPHAEVLAPYKDLLKSDAPIES